MLRYLIALLCLCLFGWLILEFTGYVIVHDETGLATSVRVVNSEWRQDLTDLPFGYFVAIPDLEGGVEVRCADGSIVRGGYVTRHWQERVTIVGNGTCAELVQG
ncbi:MAG TPA: hypothetical protein VLA50_00465 [Erythrobacter sp.]|nr:hypothetical protein [Erythrobacter sp.]